MSIFKATFKPYIARQINTRQNLLKQPDKRGPALQQYVSGKAPWIKMTSLVNYNDSIDLAKKYVLMGGTLVPKPNDDTNSMFGMRHGINNNQGAYGSNLGNRQYGIRPMPGIASADIKSKSAYGSLREATVKYYAWDKVQQDELSILFQTPGYAVVLEWGWSMYLDTSIPNDKYDSISDTQSIKASTSFKMATTEPTTIDCFAPEIKPTDMYDNLEKLRYKYSGNYDGMLGFIRNFEWQLMPGGGYECTVVLISIGDVLDTIKMNSFTGNNALKGKNADYKDEFETLLTNYTTFQDEAGRLLLPDVTSMDNLISEQNLSSVIDTNIYMLSLPTGISYKINAKMADAIGINNYYMQLGHLIFIINNTRNLFLDGKSGEKSQEKIINIEIPLPDISKNRGNGLCIASKYSISIDPSTCLLKNSQADLFTSHTVKGLVTVNGFLPDVSVYRNTKRDSFDKEYLYSTTKLGAIGNIYVNIGKVISIYKNEQSYNNGPVYLGSYLRAILSSLSFSLGSVNNFDLYVEDSTVVIIDKAYTESGHLTEASGKFIMNMAGTDTIVRNHVIKSKIFPSQATMIAIGAGVNENLGSVQTSTYNYINTGLTSRLFKEITDIPNQEVTGSEKLKEIYVNNIVKMVSVVDNNILRLGTLGPDGESILGTMNSYLNTLLVKVVADTNYKAIIPISLEATIDGIGGITIGEIFTVNKDILPRQYSDRSIGFIVTGINNNITRPDWTTTIITQICLLDQEGFKETIEKSYDNVKGMIQDKIIQNIETIGNDIRNFNTIIAFIEDFYQNNFKLIDDRGGILDYGKVSITGEPMLVIKHNLNTQKNQNQISGDNLTHIFREFGNAIYNEAGLNNNGISAKFRFPKKDDPNKGYNTIVKEGYLQILLQNNGEEDPDNKRAFVLAVTKSSVLSYYNNIQSADVKSLLDNEINNILAGTKKEKNNYSFYLSLDSYDTTGRFIPKKILTSAIGTIYATKI